MRKNDLQTAKGRIDSTVYYGDIESYKKAFLTLHENFRSWRRVAELYGIYPNMARMIANGYDPGNKIRKLLRLPLKDKFEVCLKCNQPMGENHRCTSGDHKKRNRLSINLDNPFSAGRSIMKHMDSGKIDDLIVILMEKMVGDREG